MSVPRNPGRRGDGRDRVRRTSRRPAGRALLWPVLGLVVLVAATITLERVGPRVEQTLPPVDAPAPEVDANEVRCRRDTRDDAAARARARLPERVRVSSDAVHACPEAFDQHRVTYVGEAIGHLLPREGGAWVLVNDDGYALGPGPLPAHRDHAGTNTGMTVWLPDPLATQVSGLGGAGRRGDVIEVVGVVHRTDPANGGGLTLRAAELRVLAPSQPLRAPLHLPQAVAAAVAVLAAGATTRWALRVRGRA